MRLRNILAFYEIKPSSCMKNHLFKLSILISFILIQGACTDSDLPGSKEIELAGTKWDIQVFFTTLTGPEQVNINNQSWNMDVDFNEDGTLNITETFWQGNIVKPDGTIIDLNYFDPEVPTHTEFGTGSWTLEGNELKFSLGDESVFGDWQHTGIIKGNTMAGAYTHHRATGTTFEGVKY